MKIFLSLIAVNLLLVPPTFGQDLVTRLKQIEDNNQALANRLAIVESKIDAVAAKIDAILPKANRSGDIGVTLPSIPAGNYQARGPLDLTPLGSINVPVNVPAGNYWLRPNPSSYAGWNVPMICGPSGCYYPATSYSYPTYYQSYGTSGCAGISGCAGSTASGGNGFFNRLRARRGCQ